MQGHASSLDNAKAKLRAAFEITQGALRQQALKLGIGLGHRR